MKEQPQYLFSDKICNYYNQNQLKIHSIINHMILQLIFVYLNIIMRRRKTQQAQVGQIPSNSKQNELQLIDGLTKFYKQCSQQNKQMGDEGQTYQQFMEMKDIQPNQQGTGRISFKDVKKVQCFIITNSKQSKNIKTKQIQDKKQKIAQFLESYLNIKTQFLPIDQLQVKNNTIIDEHRGLQYQIRKSRQRIDALQMLDLLTQYKNQYCLLIAFIDQNLHQVGSDIYGRACGDGVAIIDIKMLFGNESEQAQFYQTCVHETLHMLGFDHCLAWSCLMNPLVAGDMWLCPQCLKKLKSQLSIQFEQWLNKLVKVFAKNLPNNKSLTKKSNKILQFISQNNKPKKH